MAEIEILSPAAVPASEVRPLAAGVGTLEGRVLGIRRDRTWHSFEIFADEIERLARERARVADVSSFDPEARIGSPERESARVEEFAGKVEAAVVGLGT